MISYRPVSPLLACYLQELLHFCHIRGLGIIVGICQQNISAKQSVYRNRYRKKLVREKSLGTGIEKVWNRKKVPEPVSEKIWYRKKVSEPVPEKFGTGADFCRQNFGILKIYNGYRYRIGTGTRNFSFFSGGIRTGIGKKFQNRYR